MMTQSADSEAGWADGVGAPPFLQFAMRSVGVVALNAANASRAALTARSASAAPQSEAAAEPAGGRVQFFVRLRRPARSRFR